MIQRVMKWLVRDWQWPAASLFAGCFLLVLTPFWFLLAGPALALVYVQLPIYMLHQWEEHAGDRFRRYVNQTLAGGREALTPIATFWINSLGVWAVDVAALYLAVFFHLGLGLFAIYLALVNALGHMIPAVVRREYNPGLWTVLGLFVPMGIWGLVQVGAAADTGPVDHVIGLGIAVAIHVAIIVHMARRMAILKRLTVN